MRVDDFVRFLGFYRDERHDLDARNESGQRFIEMIATHRHGKPFADAMIAAGAKPAENVGP
jgi:hypothetical protein